jgi:hypothetical protein
MLTINLHLVPRPRTRGAIPPLPNTPSQRVAQLKAHGLYFYFTLLYFTLPFRLLKLISDNLLSVTSQNIRVIKNGMSGTCSTNRED